MTEGAPAPVLPDHPDDITIKPPKNYALRGAVIFLVCHVFFIILLFVWSAQKSIFSPTGGNFILYLIELPGVFLTKSIGQADNLSLIAPYAIAFFANTVFYTAIGLGLGSLLHELGWIDELENLFLTDEEIQIKQEQENEG